MAGVNPESYYSSPITFTDSSGAKTWTYNGSVCVNGNCDGVAQVELMVNNPDIGTCIFQQSTGGKLSKNTTITFPAQNL